MAKGHVSRGAIILALVSTLVGAVFASPAVAASPEYTGLMNFPAITSLAGPEEFTWEVRVSEEQELRSIDDQSAAVYYEDGVHIALVIDAIPAHDVTGASVPTSLAVSEGNLVTMTVHHRAGNPEAEGAPFDYPVSGGAGWVTGFSSVQITLPKDEAELRREEEQRRAEQRRAALEGRQFHIPCTAEGRTVARMRPSRCLVSEPHGPALLAGLDWRGWQGRVARADGFLVDPEAHAKQAVRVALSGTVTCDGLRYYKRLRLKPTAGPPSVFAISPC